MAEGALSDPNTSSPPAPARLALRTRIWRRVSGVAARVREWCPITVRGFGIALSAAVCLRWFGFRDLDGVWYVAGIGLLALSALSFLCTCLGFGLLWLSVRRKTSAQPHLSTDTELPISSGFHLPSLRFVPLVEVRAALLPPVAAELQLEPEGARNLERITFHDHGEMRSVVRRIEVRDVLGLSAIAMRAPGRLEVDVLPHLGAFRSLPLLYSLSGGDDMPHPLGVDQGDRLELKRYAPGDPARFIHWKVFARTGKLVVRMPERALSRAYRVAAYLCAAEDDGPSAAAARAALMFGALGADFRFGADGSRDVARDAGEGLVQVRRSSAARAHTGDGLVPFVAQVEREGPCSLVVFAPPTGSTAVARVRDLLRIRARPVRVVIGVDGIAGVHTRPWLRRVLFAVPPARAVDAAELHASVTAFRKLGCEVVVLDRVSGRILSDAYFAQPKAPSERAA